MFDSHQKFLFHERVIVCLTLTGIAITSLGETNFVLAGFIYQLLSSSSEAVKIFLMDPCIKELKLDHLSLLFYTTPLCFIMMGITCLVIEVPLMKEIQIAALTTGPLLWLLVLNGCIALSVDVIFILLVKHTTMLTRSLSLGFKNIYLIGLSVIVFETPVTMLQYVGYGITLVAIISQYNLRLIEAIVTLQLPITTSSASYWSSFVSFIRIAYNTVIYSSGDDEGGITSYSKILANSKEEKFESKQSQVFLI